MCIGSLQEKCVAHLCFNSTLFNFFYAAFCSVKLNVSRKLEASHGAHGDYRHSNWEAAARLIVKVFNCCIEMESSAK